MTRRQQQSLRWVVPIAAVLVLASVGIALGGWLDGDAERWEAVVD
jgi:hypothetical protein